MRFIFKAAILGVVLYMMYVMYAFLFYSPGQVSEPLPSTPKHPMVAFYQLGLMGSYNERTENVITKLEESGLMENLDEFFVSVVGDPKINILPKLPEKAQVIVHNLELNAFELPTINLVHQYARRNPDHYILYLHSKGVQYPLDNEKITAWIDLLLYFTVTLWDSIPPTLEDHVISCPNLLIKDIYPHCSGNFWWARADYIAKLPEQSSDSYLMNEFWIGLGLANTTNKVCIVWPNAVNHYKQKLPFEEYSHIQMISCIKEYPDCVKTKCDQYPLREFARRPQAQP